MEELIAGVRDMSKGKLKEAASRQWEPQRATITPPSYLYLAAGDSQAQRLCPQITRGTLGQIRVEMLRLLSGIEEVRPQEGCCFHLCLESLSPANNANMQTSAVQRIRSTRGIPRTRFRISSGGTPVP